MNTSWWSNPAVHVWAIASNRPMQCSKWDGMKRYAILGAHGYLSRWIVQTPVRLKSTSVLRRYLALSAYSFLWYRVVSVMSDILTPTRISLYTCRVPKTPQKSMLVRRCSDFNHAGDYVKSYSLRKGVDRDAVQRHVHAKLLAMPLNKCLRLRQCKTEQPLYNRMIGLLLQTMSVSAHGWLD